MNSLINGEGPFLALYLINHWTIDTYEKKHYKTLREYAEFINERLDTTGVDLIKLMKIYEIAYYSNQMVDDESVFLCEQYYYELKLMSKVHVNKVKYYIYVYFNRIA